MKTVNTKSLTLGEIYHIHGKEVLTLREMLVSVQLIQLHSKQDFSKDLTN